MYAVVCADTRVSQPRSGMTLQRQVAADGSQTLIATAG